MLFEVIGEFYSGKLGTCKFIGDLGALVKDMDESILDRTLVFEGYESRSLQALLRMLRLAADDFDPKTREAAYHGIETSGMREFLGLMLERVSLEEGDCLLHRALAAARRLDVDGAREGEIKERLVGRIGSSDPAIRFECILSIEPGLSEEMHMVIWDALKDEDDPAVITSLFSVSNWIDEIVVSGKKTLGGIWVRDMLSKFLNARPEIVPGIHMELITRAIPYLDGIEGLADTLSPETKERLLAATDPEKYPSVIMHEALLCANFLKSALERTLESAEVMGQRICFCRMPASELGSMGRVYLNEIAVADEVPEGMVPIVAYHEFIEGKTDSHEKAINAEKEAVRTLGLKNEYAAWLDKIGQNSR